jgi:hypothetical protein
MEQLVLANPLINPVPMTNRLVFDNEHQFIVHVIVQGEPVGQHQVHGALVFVILVEHFGTLTYIPIYTDFNPGCFSMYLE